MPSLPPFPPSPSPSSHTQLTKSTTTLGSPYNFRQQLHHTLRLCPDELIQIRKHRDAQRRACIRHKRHIRPFVLVHQGLDCLLRGSGFGFRIEVRVLGFGVRSRSRVGVLGLRVQGFGMSNTASKAVSGFLQCSDANCRLQGFVFHAST
jgi:hypothetical protein